LENRFGAPNPAANYNRTTSLPWTTAVAVDTNGCEFASSLLNLSDAIISSAALISGNAGSVLSNVANTYLGGALDAICDAGCVGVGPTGATGCNIPAGCGGCPRTLRDATQCKALVTDTNSCAAASLVQSINAGWP
jgi:hypothetical protein